MEEIEKGLEALVEQEFERKKDVLATRDDIGRLVGGLIAKIAQSEARLTMRMFYFWIGQIAVLSGILAFFFKTLH